MEDTGDGTSERSKRKKKNKQCHRDPLMVTVERKDKRMPTEGATDHLKIMLEGPCPNHAYKVKYAHKDYRLLK